MIFNYPRHKAVDTNDLWDQIVKIEEEIAEMKEAYLNNPDIKVFFGEAADAHHALETLFRIGQEKRGISPSEVRRGTERKNHDRGYYA